VVEKSNGSAALDSKSRWRDPNSKGHSGMESDHCMRRTRFDMRRTRFDMLSREQVYAVVKFVYPIFETDKWLLHNDLHDGIHVEAESLYLMHQDRPKVIEDLCQSFDNIAHASIYSSAKNAYAPSKDASLSISIPLDAYAPRALEEKHHIRPNITAVDVHLNFRPDADIENGGRHRFEGIQCVVRACSQNKPP